MKLFTIGYEKREMPDFINALLAQGVAAVADVRIRPFSHKKGFSKKALGASLEKSGIEYYHFAELGSPLTIRDKLRADGDFAGFFKAYKRHLEGQKEAVERLHSLALSKQTALLCFERDVNQCHRKAISEYLRNLFPGKYTTFDIE